MNSELTEKDKKACVLLYKKDGLSYALALLASCAEFIYVVNVLDSIEVNFLMGITVMINIMLLFSIFTCAVKVNMYNRRWAVMGSVMGIYMLIRQFILVPFVLKPYDGQFVIATGNILGAVLLLAASLISVQRIQRRKKIQKIMADV